jgi:hypothetical protein
MWLAKGLGIRPFVFRQPSVDVMTIKEPIFRKSISAETA